MFGFIRKTKEKKEKEAQKKAEENAKAKENAEAAIAIAREKLLSLPCPFNDSDKCFDSCAHFKEGKVYPFVSPYYGHNPIWMKEMPKCKLWSS